MTLTSFTNPHASHKFVLLDGPDDFSQSRLPPQPPFIQLVPLELHAIQLVPPQLHAIQLVLPQLHTIQLVLPQLHAIQLVPPKLRVIQLVPPQLHAIQLLLQLLVIQLLLIDQEKQHPQHHFQQLFRLMSSLLQRFFHPVAQVIPI